MKRLFVCLLIGVYSGIAAAQAQRYVTDRLEVTLRSGKGTEFRVVKMLPSGAPVTILESDEASGYSRIRSGGGDEGWVLTRYLLSEPAAREKLAQLEANLEKLATDKKQLEEQLTSLSGTQKKAEKDNSTLSADNKKLEQELARIRQTAANALTIDAENQSIKKKLFSLERDFQMLQQENDALSDRSDRDWFVAGAGVLLVGMVLGLVLPKLRVRRKTSWGSL